MKENGIYGTELSKDALIFLLNHGEAMMPFNSFIWRNTLQGHNYWYEKALKWVICLYENYENINLAEKEKKSLSLDALMISCYNLLKYYCLEEEKKENLMKIDAYNKVTELYHKLHSESH